MENIDNINFDFDKFNKTLKNFKNSINKISKLEKELSESEKDEERFCKFSNKMFISGVFGELKKKIGSVNYEIIQRKAYNETKNYNNNIKTLLKIGEILSKSIGNKYTGKQKLDLIQRAAIEIVSNQTKRELSNIEKEKIINYIKPRIINKIHGIPKFSNYSEIEFPKDKEFYETQELINARNKQTELRNKAKNEGLEGIVISETKKDRSKSEISMEQIYEVGIKTNQINSGLDEISELTKTAQMMNDRIFIRNRPESYLKTSDLNSDDLGYSGMSLKDAIKLEEESINTNKLNSPYRTPGNDIGSA